MINNFLKGVLSYKFKILNLIYENSKDLSISDIKRKLNISYKETYRHTKELVLAGLVKRDKREREKHEPVKISLTEEGKKFIEYFSKP